MRCRLEDNVFDCFLVANAVDKSLLTIRLANFFVVLQANASFLCCLVFLFFYLCCVLCIGPVMTKCFLSGHCILYAVRRFCRSAL